jgi:hypothetical protein
MSDLLEIVMHPQFLQNQPSLSLNSYYARFEVLTAITMKITVFWDVTP